MECELKGMINGGIMASILQRFVMFIKILTRCYVGSYRALFHKLWKLDL